jgi:hypothetical protein
VELEIDSVRVGVLLMRRFVEAERERLEGAVLFDLLPKEEARRVRNRVLVLRVAGEEHFDDAARVVDPAPPNVDQCEECAAAGPLGNALDRLADFAPELIELALLGGRVEQVQGRAIDAPTARPRVDLVDSRPGRDLLECGRRNDRLAGIVVHFRQLPDLRVAQARDHVRTLRGVGLPDLAEEPEAAVARFLLLKQLRDQLLDGIEVAELPRVDLLKDPGELVELVDALECVLDLPVPVGEECWVLGKCGFEVR